MLAYYGPEWESLASRIVGRWCPSFTGNTGLQLPDTTGRNHGTLNNFANNGNDAYVASPDKLALNFDGVNDRLAVNTVNLSTLDFALSFWAQQRGAGAIGMPIGNSTTTTSYIWFRSGNYLRFQMPTGNVEFNLTTFTTFRHYCIFSTPSTAAISTINLFVDGVSIGALTLAAGTFTVNAIGDGYSSNAFPFPGVIDDVIVFGQGLRPHEPRFIYDQGRGGGMLYQPPRRRSVAAIIAALVLACETGNYSLTGQAAGLFASRLLAADQAQYILSGNAANITASRLLSVDPASYTATGNDAATICARLLDSGAAAYALTGTDAGLIANRKLTADQAVCFLAGNNAELLRSLKLNAGSMALQLDNFAASLLADRKISADGAQYILVVSDANLGDSASGVAPFYYLFMLRGPQ
jgi:hypothetical protein